MSNNPGYVWPDGTCYIEGTTLHVQQTRWKQRESWLPLVEPAKWMVVVYVNDVLVHGQVPSLASDNTTAYTDEMPLSQTSMTVDLAADGVSDTSPLDPKVRVDQYAATKTTVGWRWNATDWEFDLTPHRTYIDSNAGVHKPLTVSFEPDEQWMPLFKGFYDEGAVTPDDFLWSWGANSDALDSSVGMQFRLMLPTCSIDGIQVWTPPELWDEPGFEPREVTLRLWEGQAGIADDNVVRIATVMQEPGWLNVLFEDEGPWYADTALIPDPDPDPGQPYSLLPNPAHDGWYIVGYQLDGGAYYRGPSESGSGDGYARLYPEHRKVFMLDNWPAGTHLVNKFGSPTETGPEWAPFFNEGNYLMVGPIVSFRPIYPIPKAFRPQIYRRVVTEAV